MHHIKTPKYNQIEFVSTIFSLREKDKGRGGMILHILGYKEEKSSSKIDAVCLEFGIFVEGKNEENILKKFDPIIDDIYYHYNTKKILAMIKDSSMENFWALYREYSYKKSGDTIKQAMMQTNSLINLTEEIEKKDEEIKNLKKQIVIMRQGLFPPTLLKKNNKQTKEPLSFIKHSKSNLHFSPFSQNILGN